MGVWAEYTMRWVGVVLVVLWLICDVIFPLCVGLPALRLFRGKTALEHEELKVVKQKEDAKRWRQLAALRARKDAR